MAFGEAQCQCVEETSLIFGELASQILNWPGFLELYAEAFNRTWQMRMGKGMEEFCVGEAMYQMYGAHIDLLAESLLDTGRNTPITLFCQRHDQEIV